MTNRLNFSASKRKNSLRGPPVSTATSPTNDTYSRVQEYLGAAHTVMFYVILKYMSRYVALIYNASPLVGHLIAKNSSVHQSPALLLLVNSSL